MIKDAVYKGTRQVRTYVDLFHAAKIHLETAKTAEKDLYFTTMSALLFAAFTFEAYLNHLGERTFSFWEEIDNIRVMDKYSVLCKTVKVDPDFSTRPYQTLRLLFQFRNAIAHGRSEELIEVKEVSRDTDPAEHAPKTKWELYCTRENAERAIADLSQIITELHEAAGLGTAPFVWGATVSTITVKNAT